MVNIKISEKFNLSNYYVYDYCIDISIFRTVQTLIFTLINKICKILPIFIKIFTKTPFDLHTIYVQIFNNFTNNYLLVYSI
jgi:hypothetical protein